MITFFVPGLPATQGSKKHIGHGILVDSCKRLPQWRNAVMFAAHQAMSGKDKLTGPVSLQCLFMLPRPKSHFRTGAHCDELKLTAPIWHTSKPDLGKMTRAVEDACKGVVWHDDSQVCWYDGSQKKYANERIGVVVVIEQIKEIE